MHVYIFFIILSEIKNTCNIHSFHVNIFSLYEYINIVQFMYLSIVYTQRIYTIKKANIFNAMNLHMMNIIKRVPIIFILQFIFLQIFNIKNITNIK